MYIHTSIACFWQPSFAPQPPLVPQQSLVPQEAKPPIAHLEFWEPKTRLRRRLRKPKRIEDAKDGCVTRDLRTIYIGKNKNIQIIQNINNSIKSTIQR